jgi:hypothetical protein
MAQQGWHPDPAGGNGLRWFDGVNWTRHVQAAPPQPVPVPALPSAPPQQQNQYQQPLPQPVRATVRRKQVYADAEGFAYGSDGMRWSEADWVCYFVERKYVHVYGAGAPILPQNRVRGRGSRWVFSIGRDPYPDAPQVTVQENLMRTEAPESPVWGALTRLARQHLEPRLVARYVDGVRAGRRLLLAKELWIDPVGFQSTAISVPWNELGEIRHKNGAMFIHRRGVEQAQLKYPMAINNAPLVPAVFAALRRG